MGYINHPPPPNVITLPHKQVFNEALLRETNDLLHFTMMQVESV